MTLHRLILCVVAYTLWWKAHLEDGDIESSTTQVENENGLVLLAVKAVRQGSGGGLVDDAEHIHTCNTTGILGCLALAVVEVCWHCDDCLLNLHSGVILIRNMCTLRHCTEELVGIPSEESWERGEHAMPIMISLVSVC